MGLPLVPPDVGTDTNAYLKVEQSVTFDPLGVATVLPNERANKSAVRLYTQYPRNSFQWPHLMMVGGALPPLGVFVDHILSHNRAIHPALTMALQYTNRLPVRSTMVFKELPLDFSNVWLEEFCNFRPSSIANNDFLIINIDDDDDEGGGDKAKTPHRSLKLRLLGATFSAVGLLTGAAITAGFVLSVLVGDIWAAVLFFIYDSHWFASNLVSYTKMIGPRMPPAKIVPDAHVQYAVYERKEGGTVVFKGRKDSFERWFRQTWQFNDTPWNTTLHWFWILTGTLAAIGSTAAMVNMYAYFQLGFLGILFFSSLAELLLARVGREVELGPYEARTKFFGDNASRSEAMIKCALEAPSACQVTDLDWISLGLLPDIGPFRYMQETLKKLGELQPGDSEVEVEKLVQDYRLAAAASGPLPLFSRVAKELWASGIERCNVYQHKTKISASSM